MHTVAVLALDDFVPLDLAIPCDIFGSFRLAGQHDLYRVQVCGVRRTLRSRAFEVRVPFGLDAVMRADTVVVPGILDPLRPFPEPALQALRAAWANGARVTSICTGAFALAAAGLLDGRRATTHWLGAAELARLYPTVKVQPDVLFVDEGRIVTSAGASAGIDMCLHLVRRDHGQAAASQIARLAVAQLNRDGGQAPFIRQEVPRAREDLAPLLEWMGAHLHEPLDVETLARRARMSPRTLARRFRAQTGTTPLQWLLTARIRKAQELLETTRRSIEDIAARTGFDSPVTFRARFRRIVGLSPRAWRARFTAPAQRAA